MPAFIDLTGRKFDRLTVLEKAPKDSSGRTKWLCICDCGKQTIVEASALKSGGTRSCGCLCEGIKKNLTGQRFGMLTVLWPAPRIIGEKVRWVCRCDCGGETVTSTTSLQVGYCKSCGCLRGCPNGVLENWVGRRFGRLVVLEQLPRGQGRQIKYRCICDCGQEKITSRHCLSNGDSQSCGCLNRELHATQDGLSRSVEYAAWRSMLDRCYDKRHPAYKNYGARGIRVCKRWRGENGFKNFYKDMGPKPEPGLSLDRIDNDADYSPENCRWSDFFEQNQNRRTVKNVEFHGEVKCVAQWAREIGIASTTLHQRLRKWSLEKALTTPPDKRKVSRSVER